MTGIRMLGACLLLTVPLPGGAAVQNELVHLPPAPNAHISPASDWLINNASFKAVVYRSADNRSVVLSNGLVRRTIRITPDGATVALDNLMTGASMLRAVKPEALLEIDGADYPVGGLTGQPDLAYLSPEWLDSMKPDSAGFHLAGLDVGQTQQRFPWKRPPHSTGLPWPPPGVSLTLHFRPPIEKLAGVAVDVHYELYDGIPLISKWLTIRNESRKAITLNRFTSEILGFVEYESIVDPADHWQPPDFTVVTDYSFGGMSLANSARTVNWVEDPAYTTQVNYLLKTPAMLETRPPLGPDIAIPPGGRLDTFRTFELTHDSSDRERKGLEVRKMYRVLAPWCVENPLMMHLTSTDPVVARRAIDQCANVGFEMVILSFGSGLNMEDDSSGNIRKFKALADYAHSRGIRLGGYSLLASRRISEEDDVINPLTGKTGGAIFGNSPCLGSRWGIEYFRKIRHFLEATGFDLLEHDGSYPGDRCASTVHPGHRGLEDSQWTQFQEIADFYRWCRARDIYLNVPDWYFLVGSNKTAMGYRESNWSLPRPQQQIHARQNLFDGTWEKTPSMGWMFVPLVEYQGGGAAATIEPLKDHLPDYERHLENNLGYGVQACYRGPRLFDSERTRLLVKNWVDFFKKHRTILESDVIHLRRADGRDLDYILHVNPGLPEKGLAMVYNPTGEAISRELTLPLYYTGIRTSARISVNDGPITSHRLDRDYRVRVKVTVPAGGASWVVIR